MIQIISCGVYVPALRVGSSEIAKALGAYAGAGIKKKALPEVDEDAFTMAVEAAKEALLGMKTLGGSGDGSLPSARAGGGAVEGEPGRSATVAGTAGTGTSLGPGDIDYVAFASTSFPYEEKSFAGALAECLGIPKTAFVGEFGSSTRAGTEALISAASALASGAFRLALVVVSDCPGGGPRNPVEQAAGAGAVAFVLQSGENEDRCIFSLEGSSTWSKESLGIRSRRTGFTEASDLGIARHSRDAFVGTCVGAVRALLEKERRVGRGESEEKACEAALSSVGSEFRGLVATQPDARLPLDLGRTLGFQDERVLPGIVASDMGDAGAASCLLGLLAYLESGSVKPGDLLLLVSYGSGAIADALRVRVGRGVDEISRQKPLRSLLDAGTDVDFVTYLRVRGWL
ncbi:MAG TPA: hypothetical protein GX507_03505 [Clostridia bacterium]|nr:hypothetical protein [Clostridia bacterium]